MASNNCVSIYVEGNKRVYSLEIYISDTLMVIEQ